MATSSAIDDQLIANNIFQNNFIFEQNCRKSFSLRQPNIQYD
jgi:hypothetical protein